MSLATAIDIESRLYVKAKQYLRLTRELVSAKQQYKRLQTIPDIKPVDREAFLEELESLKEEIREKKQKKEKVARRIEELVKEHPVYQEYFRKLPRVGAVLPGCILGIIPARFFGTVSKLWKYTGYAPKETYQPKNGKMYSRSMSAVVHQIAMTLIRKDCNSPYRSFFEEWLQEERTKEPHAPAKKIFLRALRKVKKLWLAHYFQAYHLILGLKYREVYSYVKLLKVNEFIPPLIYESGQWVPLPQISRREELAVIC